MNTIKNKQQNFIKLLKENFFITPPFQDNCQNQTNSAKYLFSASCQVGRGLNPFSTNFDLSKRELKGRAALDKPYSFVVTGITVFV